MSYEREKERLLQLWRDVESDEEANGSVSEDEPEDRVSSRSGDSKTDQEVSDEKLELVEEDVPGNDRFLCGKIEKQNGLNIVETWQYDQGKKI
ncbi:hypothetical protein NQ314_003415 [Rhamnusium bicolor]|uniref:Uncharacterized protein n=1 Tax=Rhamnusium bicolor TaxID=1586634 RepID=A0AAV8ZPT9_9CUCU|nr:hypothetical protein NQ314_003415 [Rhamnusium bicolor]